MRASERAPNENLDYLDAMWDNTLLSTLEDGWWQEMKLFLRKDRMRMFIIHILVSLFILLFAWGFFFTTITYTHTICPALLENTRCRKIVCGIGVVLGILAPPLRAQPFRKAMKQ